VEHILNPILATIEAIGPLHAKDASLRGWIDSAFGGADALRRDILADFFRREIARDRARSAEIARDRARSGSHLARDHLGEYSPKEFAERRYGFDGSGADNFFDAGSCIDGRLTSAWNWCSQAPNARS